MPTESKRTSPDTQAGGSIGETHMVLPAVLTLLGLRMVVCTSKDFRDQLVWWEGYLKLGSLVLLAIGMTYDTSSTYCSEMPLVSA